MIKEITVSITIPMRFPDEWNDKDIDFYLNENSWCFRDWLDQLNEYAKEHDGCMCSLCEVKIKD